MKDRYNKNRFKPYKKYEQREWQEPNKVKENVEDEQLERKVDDMETDNVLENDCEIENNLEQQENCEQDKQSSDEGESLDDEIDVGEKEEPHQEKPETNQDCEGEKNVSDAYFKQLLSLQAEFDNYRKRTQADVSKAYQNGFNEAITEFLPALDSFKMATDMITDKNTLMGIQYIEKGILSVLEKMGISVIDTSGEFDPNLHQAIGTDSEADVESGHIVKECFKGFKMGDKVIRYAQVIVKK